MSYFQHTAEAPTQQKVIKTKRKRMRRIIVDKTELETFDFESLTIDSYWLDLYNA